MRLALQMLAAAGVVALALFCLTALEIALYARRSTPGAADAAVVLGAAVNLDRPSPVFEERIRHAVELHRMGRAPVLVMTGGTGPGDRASEAATAAVWAESQGVSASAMLLEDRSRTTQENLTNSVPLLASNGLKRVLLVSDPLHMRRATAIARRLGLDAHPSPTPTTRYTGWRSWTSFLLSETYYLARCRVGGRC